MLVLEAHEPHEAQEAHEAHEAHVHKSQPAGFDPWGQADLAEAMGTPLPEVTPDHVRAARTALRERPSWDAHVPIEPLAAATWPKLVIIGTWESASSQYRAWVGDAMTACGRIVAERIGAALLSVPGAAHEPHREQPATVNTALRDLWDRGEAAGGIRSR